MKEGSELRYEKVIIIGAPRSGTNMLRDILTSFDNIATWPCDEINYIWRHGNMFYPSDEIPTQNATNQIKKYILGSFDFIHKKYNADFLIEKTCANSLRVPFVDKVVPDAKYIFIYRDGIDVTGSAKKRWTAKLDISYILRKARFIPITDLPIYAARYFFARFFRFFSKEGRLAFWGPAIDDMDTILQKYSLNEVCALQWQSCVDKAEDAFSKMSDDKVIRLRYEDFVCQPENELNRILKFIGKDIEAEKVVNAVKNVSDRSIGKGRKALGDRETSNIEALVKDTLKRYDYL
jgi:hypothetical protein